MTRKKHRPYPEELVLHRMEAGTENEFYDIEEKRHEVDADEPEQRIAVYQLVKVLLPETETRFTEVENDNGG